MDRKVWLRENRAAINARLEGLGQKPDGTLYFEPSGVHYVTIRKLKDNLTLLLSPQTSNQTSLVQSRLNLKDPLYLASPYTQAALLGLIWPNRLRRAYVLGFGGGRVPLVLHHYYPEAIIECSEIDPLMIELSQRFFGVALDERLQVAIEDGRSYLARRQTQFDFIFVDVFLGNGYSPYRLFTREFYRLCRSRLSPEGALVLNILNSAPLYPEKIKTVQSVFEQVYLCPIIGGNRILFATQQPRHSYADLVRRAKTEQDHHRFPFPFVVWVSKLKTGSALQTYVPDLESAPLLTDAVPPNGYEETLPSFDTAFTQPEPQHPCPCGSGRSFRACHGRPPE